MNSTIKDKISDPGVLRGDSFIFKLDPVSTYFWCKLGTIVHKANVSTYNWSFSEKLEITEN